MFEPAFMRLALMASVAAGVSLGVMGVYLTIRRVIFLGLVLANAATVGAAVAQIFGWPSEVLSVLTAIVTAMAVGAVPAPRRISSESIMGWTYAAASSATVLVLAGAARGDADTLHLLYGNVLAVSTGHAQGLAIIAIVILVAHEVCGQRFLLVTLDAEGAQVAGVRAGAWSLGLSLLIGVAAATAVHEIGALLAFALLTLAPSASLLVARSIRATFGLSAAIAASSMVLGLVGSFLFDLPPGPLSVAVLASAVVVAAAAGRGRR